MLQIKQFRRFYGLFQKDSAFVNPWFVGLLMQASAAVDRKAGFELARKEQHLCFGHDLIGETG